jgi:hypothetical protein
MYLDQLSSGSNARLKQILLILENVHGVNMNINWKSPDLLEFLEECKEDWTVYRDKIISESTFNSYQQNPAYTKAMLILEAVHIMLTEIAPKRQRRTKTQESIESMETTMQAPKPTFASQLSDIAAKVPQNSQQATAFSNALAAISDKLANKGAAFSTSASDMDPTEKSIISWIRSLPRPVNVSNMIQDGIAKFGDSLLSARNARLSRMPQVDEEMQSNALGKLVKLGSDMIDYSERARPANNQEMAMMNAFSRVGDKLKNMGTAFGPSSLSDNEKKIVRFFQTKQKTAGQETPSVDIMAATNEHGATTPGMTNVTEVWPFKKKPQVKVTQISPPTPSQLAAKNPQQKGVQVRQIKPGELEKERELEIPAYLRRGSMKEGMCPHCHKDPCVCESISNDRDHDGDADFADIMIARMVKSGVPQHVAIQKVKNKSYNKESTIAENDMMHATTAPVQNKAIGQAHHYEYQASMARSELYRNAKYAMSMMQQVDPNGEVPPWIAASLTKASNLLDKVFHYLDYYKTFEPDQLPEEIGDQTEPGETSGGVTRQNLLMVIEYSQKLFNMIKPGDKLEGWVAMKLTTASECISSCKHYMDYVQFEKHALDDHFHEGKKAKKLSVEESRILAETEDLEKASTIINAKGISSKVQDIAEKVATLSVDELMPLVDVMREQFGPEVASGFNTTVKGALESLLDAATKTKEDLDGAITSLQSGNVPAQQTDIEKAGPEPSGEKTAPEDDSDIAADLASSTGDKDAPGEEPLGRAKKDELAETLSVGMKVNVTNPKATPRHLITKIDGEKITIKQPDGKEGTFPKARILKANPNLTEGKKPDFLDVDKDGNKKEPFTKAIKDKKKSKKVNEAAQKCMECGSGTYMEGKDGKMRCDECGHIMIAEAKKWIQKAIKKPGALHKQLGVPAGEKIPAGKLKAAAKKGGKLGQRARMAMTLKKMHETEIVQEVSPPGKEAEKWIKANKKRFIDQYGEKKGEQVLYAKAWKQFGESVNYKLAEETISDTKKLISNLESQLQIHKKVFAKSLQEGQTTDPLKLGYGLEGDAILLKIKNLNKKISEAKSIMRHELHEGVIGMIKQIELLNKGGELSNLKNSTPYGVIYQTSSGRKSKKMFENIETRNYWLDLKGNTIANVRLIDPETFDKAINSLA